MTATWGEPYPDAYQRDSTPYQTPRVSPHTPTRLDLSGQSFCDARSCGSNGALSVPNASKCSGGVFASSLSGSASYFGFTFRVDQRTLGCGELCLGITYRLREPIGLCARLGQS